MRVCDVIAKLQKLDPDTVVLTCGEHGFRVASDVLVYPSDDVTVRSGGDWSMLYFAGGLCRN